MNRQQFIKSTALSGAALGAFSLTSFKANTDSQLDKKLVQEFVSKSHSDIKIVKELLLETPTLINAAHDWNSGDFETGLGAASHVGNIEVIRFLLDNGAQTNIFTACVLGKLEIVKLMLQAFPNTLNAKGPHGFTLLHHAIKGGDQALEVKEFLEDLGLTKTKLKIY